MLVAEEKLKSTKFEDCTEFRSHFRVQPFLCRHRLADHELFTNEALHRLATKAGNGWGSAPRRKFLREATAPGFLVVTGRGPVRWGSSEFHDTLDRAFADLSRCNVRLKITGVDEHEGYRELLHECTREFSELTGIDFNRNYGPGLATLFIASPHETTPYHIDEEENFLLQLRGTKQALIFDGNDRTVVTERDLEQFWFGRCFIERHPTSRYQTFHLAAGDALFNPPFFPHLMTSGAQASVSLSLAYQRRCFPVAEVHRMNAYLRKMGLRPSAPGRHPTLDAIKSQTVRRTLWLKKSVLGG